jgi:TRAP-type C4-dicarboxylate transport system permease small subunit
MQAQRPQGNPVLAFFDPVVRIAAIVGGYGLLALALLVGFEVVARKRFAYSLQGVDEIGGYIVAAMAAFGFSHALLHKAHTRIDIFTARLPRPWQAGLNLAALWVLAMFACFMAWRGWGALSETIDFKSVSSTPLRTPLWIPQSVWLAGLVLFAGVSAAVAVHAAWLTLRGSREALAHYGPRTLEQEIESELLEIAALDAAPPTSDSKAAR